MSPQKTAASLISLAFLTICLGNSKSARRYMDAWMRRDAGAAGPLLGRDLFAFASLQPCQVRLAALKNCRRCGKRIPKGPTSGYLIRGYALSHLIFMKHEKLKSDEKSLHLPTQKGGPAQKVKWSESPAVKRARSMSSVLSAKVSSNIIHEASGKW